MSGRTVLVTGAGGFVGPHLARVIHARGLRVAGLGIEPPPAALEVESWHHADLRDPESIHAAVAAVAPEAIVHLAGQSSAARSFEDPVGTLQANVIGTWSVLEATRRAVPRARVLVVASGEVYGPQAEGVRAREDDPFRPLSPYALSKATADTLAKIHADTYGLEVIRVRAFGHTGPGQDDRFVVPSFARQIAGIEAGKSEAVLRVGNLDVVRDLTDVRDVVEAYARLIERGRPGTAYNVCRGEGVKLADLVDRLAAKARIEVRIEVDPTRLRPADVPRLVGDPARIAADTGWNAAIPLDRTLDDVLADWRARG